MMNLRSSCSQPLGWINFLLTLSCALAAPAFGDSRPVTYKDTAGSQHVYYFMIGNDTPRTLVLNYSPDGSNWNWADLAVPPGEVAIAYPSAITLFDNIWSHKQFVYAFVTGASTGHLYYVVGDESSLPSWTWVDLGLPSGVTSVSNPSAVTYVDTSGKPRIYVFVEGSDGNMWLSSWVYGQGWKWANLHSPTGTSFAYSRSLSAISLFDNIWDQKQLVCAFAPSKDGDLWTVFGEPDSNNWTWHNQEHPDGAQVIDLPSAVTYVDGNGQFRIYVFVEGRDSNGINLYSNQFVFGSPWTWQNHGRPPGRPAGNWNGALSASAVAGLGPDGKDVIYAFVDGGAHLNVNYWDVNALHWQWATQADWPGGGVSTFGPPSAVTYVDNSMVRHFYIVSPGGSFNANDPTLALSVWNGSIWLLRDQGKPPVERALIVEDSGAPFQKITSLTFGSQAVGTTSLRHTIILRNTGTAPVTITQIGITSEFGVTNYDGNCPVAPAALAQGSLCLLYLTFTPSATGPRFGALLIPNNADEPWANQQGLSLVGTGQ